MGEPRGQLGTPVVGSIAKAFGEPGIAGPATGISFGAPPAARVSAPCGGRVVFAGPFRSFGQLMIVDCGGGFHFVLAGLDRLDVPVGRPVQAGEPVGVMAAWDPHTPGLGPRCTSNCVSTVSRLILRHICGADRDGGGKLAYVTSSRIEQRRAGATRMVA